jgi:hypothetical protein
MRTFFLILCLSLALALPGEPARADQQAVTLSASNPYCVQSSPATGACIINFRYLSASDPAFNHLEISIDGKVRAYMTAFFETSVYLNYAMLGDGLQVACGSPNASGIPGYGRQYVISLTAYATGSPAITDTAVVNCPYFEGKNFLPVVSK